MNRRIVVWLMFVLLGGVTAQGQTVIGSRFKPLSYEELMLYAEAEAARDAYNREKYKEYKDKAYEYYNHSDYSGFIYYSDYALRTGYSSGQLYYDRGKAYERLDDYKHAKREYRKAKNRGYYDAVRALEQCKESEKYWRKSRKSQK